MKRASSDDGDFATVLQALDRLLAVMDKPDTAKRRAADRAASLAAVVALQTKVADLADLQAAITEELCDPETPRDDLPGLRREYNAGQARMVQLKREIAAMEDL